LVSGTGRTSKLCRAPAPGVHRTPRGRSRIMLALLALVTPVGTLGRSMTGGNARPRRAAGSTLLAGRSFLLFWRAWVITQIPLQVVPYPWPPDQPVRQPRATMVTAASYLIARTNVLFCLLQPRSGRLEFRRGTLLVPGLVPHAHDSKRILAYSPSPIVTCSSSLARRRQAAFALPPPHSSSLSPPLFGSLCRRVIIGSGTRRT